MNILREFKNYSSIHSDWRKWMETTVKSGDLRTLHSKVMSWEIWFL